MTIIRNSNDADGVNTFPAAVETVGQTGIVVSTPEGTHFGGNNIRVQAPANHGLRKGDTVLIDSRGFLVIDGETGDDAETETTPQTPAAPAFAMGDRVRITGERFNGRTGTVTDEYGTVNNPKHAHFGRTWVGVKLDQSASAYTPRSRQFTDELEFEVEPETPVAPETDPVIILPANVRRAVKSLSDVMLNSLVYLARGVHRVHAMPEQRTLKALERRGLIERAEPADLSWLESGRVHLLWDVTPPGWAVLATQGIGRPADEGRLTLEEALEEANAWADRNNSDWGIGRMEDIGRLTLEEALDAAYPARLGPVPAGTCCGLTYFSSEALADHRAFKHDTVGRLSVDEALEEAYERFEQERGDWGIAVTWVPVHEQRGQRVAPGTRLRNIRNGRIGTAMREHGVFEGRAWVMVDLGLDQTTRWELSDTAEVPESEQAIEQETADDPFAPEPVATALPEISQAAQGYVKGALSRPYGMLPKHLPYNLRAKLLETGLIEVSMVPKGRWLGYGFQERDVLTRKAFAHFGATMIPDTWRLSLLDALGHAETLFRHGELDRLGIAWPLMGADPEAYSDRLSAVMAEPVYGSAAAVLGESLRLTEQRDAARRREAEALAAPLQQRTGLLSDDDLYVNREAWKATSAAMDSVGKALADQARARTAAVEAVMGLGSEALDALRYARETAAQLRCEAAERGEPYSLDRETVFADNGEPMTYQNVRVPADLVTDYYGTKAITWRRGVNAAHRAAREEQGK